MTAGQAATLGAVLYAGVPDVAPEREWLGLVQSIARGDPLALHALYERTHRIVFTLISRITRDPEAADERVLDVFCDVWRRAARYEPQDATVIGWVMNLARSRALDRRSRKRIDDESSLRERLALPVEQHWVEPQWLEVAPGISCKLLAADTEGQRISMLVRLVPGGEYPPHTHAGLEELHLLDGELWIDERKLYPGDYNRAEPGSGDQRVWSETGCSCVLVTSTQDVLQGPASEGDSRAIAQSEDIYRATIASAVELAGGAAQLARRLHVPVADLKRWLAGADRPSIGTFLKVVDLLIEERGKSR